MKIGILTFHSQLNYGGVLQALALQKVLRGLGHEVWIIDRWLCQKNSTLTLSPVGFKGYVRRLIERILCVGWHALHKRAKNTDRFIKEHLKLTKFHFVDWRDAPKDLGLDCVVVGSDQVWGRFANPEIYLMAGAPQIPAISYAASIGMPTIPHEMQLIYKDGFKRFKKILVREREAKELVESLGCLATQVLDPTLLVPDINWQKELCLNTLCEGKRLFCYLMRVPIVDALKELGKFAESNGIEIDVLLNSSVRGVPRNVGQIADLIKWWRRPHNKFVHLRLSDGPKEFAQRLLNATYVISDSFHALMFATIFRKNIRVLAPNTETGKLMFSRISEFCDRFYHGGHIISPNLQAALQSLIVDEGVFVESKQLEEAVSNSRKELVDALSLI